MDYEFFEFSQSEKITWDRFVNSNITGSIHQISDWKNFQSTIPGREVVLGFGVKEKTSQKILATTLCVQMSTGFLGKFWYYSARGPIFDPKDKEASQAAAYLIKKAFLILKKRGGIFWCLDPYLNKKNLFWKNRIFKEIPLKPSCKTYQPSDSLHIDLEQSPDEILVHMKRKGRYNINLARKKGVAIESIDPESIQAQDINDFFALNQETTDRDAFFGHQKVYYQNFLQILKKQSRLFFATYKGKRIATAILTIGAGKAIYYFGASTSDPHYRNLMAPYLLQWDMICFAKEQGCVTYDFLGIAPENEPDHAYVGISNFKWKFGGFRQTYQMGKDIILNPFWYKIYILAKKIF